MEICIIKDKDIIKKMLKLEKEILINIQAFITRKNETCNQKLFQIFIHFFIPPQVLWHLKKNPVLHIGCGFGKHNF